MSNEEHDYIILLNVTSHLTGNWLIYNVTQDEIKKMPKRLDQFEQFISRRLAVRQDIVHLSADDQQQLVNVASVYMNHLLQTAD